MLKNQLSVVVSVLVLLAGFSVSAHTSDHHSEAKSESLPPSPEKAARASKPPAPSADGHYGEILKFKKNELFDLSNKSTEEVLKAGGKTPIFVKAKVLAVCPKKGCWMKLEAKEGPYFVSFKDYSFFVPPELIGKDVAVRGTFVPHTESVAEQKHLLEDARRPKEEIEAVTAEKKTLRFIATGVQSL